MNLYDLLKTKSTVPAGKSGKWIVEKFTCTKEDVAFHNMQERIHGGRREMEPGDYTRLVAQGSWSGPMMSDTPAETRDCLPFLREARGQVLINGLGLGWCIEAIMQKPEVQHVTVIEIEPDVIVLVGPHLKNLFGARLEIVQADALTWTPPTKGRIYDAVWHDIWPGICADNLESMKTLHRRYARRTLWQGSWCRYEAQRLAS